MSIFLLNYYTMCNKSLNSLNQFPEDSMEPWYDSLIMCKTELTLLKEWSYNLLDNSIKQHLVKKCPSVKYVIDSGFDTEYLPED